MEVSVTEEEVSQLRIAVDAARYSELAGAWKQVATALAESLRVSGWTQASGGQDALDAYSRLLRAEKRVNLDA